VTAVAANSVAAAGGLELNDIITDVDVLGVGYSVGPQNDDYSLARLLGEVTPNTPVTINYKDSNDQWTLKTVVINTISADSLNVANDDSDNGLKLRSSWV
jgi:C-terminal processing protease CtpA/Prc